MADIMRSAAAAWIELAQAGCATARDTAISARDAVWTAIERPMNADIDHDRQPTAPPPRASTLDDPSVREAAEVAQILGVDPEAGLGSAEATRRLERDGRNELRSAPLRPAWRRMLAQFTDPLIYLLLGAIAISLVAWIVESRIGWPIDAIV
ncbi:MAG: cation-transporting P-type ATPase, partial [Caldimonas sp.]